MTRERTKKRARNRGRPATPSTVEAPSEFGFVSGDTPEPGQAAVSTPADAPMSGLRAVLTALKLSAGIAIVVGASLAMAWGAHRFALTTPRFAISAFTVDGNRRLSDDEIIRRAGVSRGSNIFATDLDAAEKQLLEDRWVRSVRITRQLPGTVRVELDEYEARALALIEGELFLVTPTGDPFKKLEASDPHDFPVITGLSAHAFTVDRARELERARVALEVLKQYETLPVSAVHPAEELHLSQDGSIVLTVGRRPITLQLGRRAFRQKLLMAARVLGHLGRSGEQPGIVFLDNEAHEERVVVRMR